MDFEFDKEIDVLLRQARKSETVFTATAPQSAHLDADEISAFAENALPEKAKQIYTAHLADCDSCRKSLSGLILLNPENVDETIRSPEKVVSVATTIPWYRKLFALPNLAYTFGALIVLFGGIIGFTILQNMNNSQSLEVSQISEKPQVIEQMASESVAEIPESNSLANTNMAANLNSAAIYDSNKMISNAPTNSNTGVVPNKPVLSLAEQKKDEISRESDLTAVNKESSNFSADGAMENQANQVLAEVLGAERPNQRSQNDPRNSVPQVSATPNSVKSDRQVSALPAQNRRNDATLLSPAAKAESKKAKANSETESEATTVGGKTFKRKNNVWYDAGYKQQSTVNITRGTEKYKELDKGLRAIVENLGGTVVVVWKEKAYRIQ